MCQNLNWKDIENSPTSKQIIVVIKTIKLCVYIFQRHSKSRLSCQTVEKEEDGEETSGREAGGQFNR